MGDTLWWCALVAQGIEHRSPKAGVGRSNRLGGTEDTKMTWFSSRFCIFLFGKTPDVSVVSSGQ